ncbi:hypothetical protein Ndes2437B_g07114 [Nannochloris sp. 'desiccata']
MDDVYIHQIIDGMGENLDNLSWNAAPSLSRINLNLFGSLLPSEEANKLEVWGTLEHTYPRVFLNEDESAEYIRKLEESQTRCDSLVALLPDNSAAAAAAASHKQKPTYREYIATLPAPRLWPASPKRKPADPTKLAAAQARLQSQRKQNQKSAAEKTAAALLVKNKAKTAPFPRKITQIKLNIPPNVALKGTNASKTTMTGKGTNATKGTSTSKKTTTTAIKRVSKIEKLRPKPLNVANTVSTAVQKTGCLFSLGGKCIPILVPKTAEKDEKKASNGGVDSIDAKTPKIIEMLTEMLTRHKDVVLVEPLSQNEDIAFTPGLDTCVIEQKKKASSAAVPAPSAVKKKASKRKEKEEVKGHSDVENKLQDTNNTHIADEFASPAKRLKILHPQDTVAAAAAAAAPVPPALSELSSALNALAAPFAGLNTLIDTLGASGTATIYTKGASSPSHEAGCTAKEKLLQARATAQRMSRLAAEKRSTAENGKDTHVSLMFEMHGAVALFEAAIFMEIESIVIKNKAAAGGNNGNTTTTTITTAPLTTTAPADSDIPAATSTAAASASVYDQAAAAFETCAAHSTAAVGPELTVSGIQTFTQCAAACARLRAHVIKMKSQAGAIGSTSGGGTDSWKGQKYTRQASNYSSAVDATTIFLAAFYNIEQSATKVDLLEQLAMKENNLAASRAVVAMRLMAGEIFNSRQPARLWALVDACKTSIMKI